MYPKIKKGEMKSRWLLKFQIKLLKRLLVRIMS
nr:MAG TPA: hypothetical protein [Caudoviricetes sp.]